MDTSSAAKQGIEIINFILSYNEILFIGWMLGIAQAKLIKKVKIDWGYATFNLLLVICFWYITERFTHIEQAKTTIGDFAWSFGFLLVGFGAYKFFLFLISVGTPALFGFFRNMIEFITKYKGGKEENSDKLPENDNQQPGT